MGSDEEVQEHLSLSRKYLKASKLGLMEGLLEPALFNGIHALELGIKAALISKVEGPIITHNVGGLLGINFRDVLGEEKCRMVNRVLIQYNMPRYPGLEDLDEREVKETIDFIERFIIDDVSKLIDRTRL